MYDMESSKSSSRSLVGNVGDFIHSSPDGRFEIRRAIMVNFPAAAIVNATTLAMTCSTASMLGAKFQITRGGGPEMLQWLCTRYPGGLPVGEAALSPNFELANCQYIIHTNAPNYRGRTRSKIPLLRQQLVDCYRRCLEEAYKVGAASIAFPCLGAGVVLGWRREDASRLALNTMRLWFRNPIHGAARRARIPGPIYFLTEPVGPYEYQVEAWLSAFDEIWPLPEESVLPSIEERSATPTMTIRTRKRQTKHNSDRRGGARRGHITRLDVRNCFYEEDQNAEVKLLPLHDNEPLNKEQDHVRQETETEDDESEQGSPKRRRIGRRELKSLQEGGSEEAEQEGRSRERKPPQRYGFGEL